MDIMKKVVVVLVVLKWGELIIVVDDEMCEVEGDMVGLVVKVIIVIVNWMIILVWGLFCVLMVLSIVM